MGVVNYICQNCNYAIYAFIFFIFYFNFNTNSYVIENLESTKGKANTDFKYIT
jgi:hypothetical protein